MRRWLFFLIPALALFGLIGWRVSQKRAEAAQQNAQRQARAKAPVNVDVATVARRDVVTTFEAVGTVEAPLAVDLMPKVAGRVIFLEAREGDRVEPGQVLARIEASDLEAEMRSAEAAAAQARARLAEARAGERPNDVALATEIRRQQAALTTAQSQLRQAQADYDARIAAAQAAVTDAQGRIEAAQANIASADAGIATARANVANARTRLERQQTLFKEGATAEQVVDDAQTTLDVQEGALGEARQRREAAVAARASAVAQKKAAEKQVTVARNQSRASVDVARAAIRQAQAALEGARANTGRDDAYESNLAALESAARAAEATFRAAQARYNATTLRAPLSGVVTRRYLDPGAIASPTQAVIAVGSVRSLWVNIGVPEDVSRRLAVGQTARVTFDALPGRDYTARVARMEPNADPQSRQFTVRLALDNAQGRLKPGAFARVRMETQRERNALVVPREAVNTPRTPDQPTTATVVAAQGETQIAQVRPITTGLSDGRVVAVTSGLQEGDRVVILTGRSLKDGQAVKAAPAAGQAAPADGGPPPGSGAGPSGGAAGAGRTRP